MTYRPSEEFFGPPVLVLLPSLIHLALACAAGILVLVVQNGDQQGELFDYLFRQRHLIDSYLAVGAFALSAILALIRDGMRGVRIRTGFIEYRELVHGLWPRVRKYRWAQIEGVSFEEANRIAIDLWDGRREFLPTVKDPAGLRTVLGRLAVARAIPIHGLEDDLQEAA